MGLTCQRNHTQRQLSSTKACLSETKATGDLLLLQGSNWVSHGSGITRVPGVISAMTDVSAILRRRALGTYVPDVRAGAGRNEMVLKPLCCLGLLAPVTGWADLSFGTSGMTGRCCKARRHTRRGGIPWVVAAQKQAVIGQHPSVMYSQVTHGHEDTLSMAVPMKGGTDAAALDGASINPPSVEEVVERKVQRMLERKIDLWAPGEVFEMMPLLLKGDYVETYIERQINASMSARDVSRLTYSRDFLINMKSTEQERLSREWIQEMLEAATESTEAMDQLVFELVESDDHRVLLDPIVRTLDNMLRTLQESSPDEKTLTQVVMEAIKQRIEAEVATRDRPYVRLLAALLRMRTPEERERLLRAELRSSSLIEEFAEYVVEAADYVTRASLGPTRLPDDTSDELNKILMILRSFVRPFDMGSQPLRGTIPSPQQKTEGT